jgi:gas vesicle structural protein
MSNSDDLETSTLVLSDLLNRVLDKGVVISGHVTISIADIDLLELDLRLLLTSIETATRRNMRLAEPPGDADTPVLPRRRAE